MIRLILLAATLSVGTPASAKPRDFHAEFDAIARLCKVPRQWLAMGQDGTVAFVAPETERYADMMCIVRELKAHKVPMKMGYVQKNG